MSKYYVITGCASSTTTNINEQPTAIASTYIGNTALFAALRISASVTTSVTGNRPASYTIFLGGPGGESISCVIFSPATIYNRTEGLQVNVLPTPNIACGQSIKNGFALVINVSQYILDIYFPGDIITMIFGQTVDSTSSSTTVVLSVSVERLKSPPISNDS